MLLLLLELIAGHTGGQKKEEEEERNSSSRTDPLTYTRCVASGKNKTGILLLTKGKEKSSSLPFHSLQTSHLRFFTALITNKPAR